MNELNRENEPTPTIDWDRVRPQLDDLVGELNGRDREAVLLRFFEGKGFAEIGARLRLSEDGARSRVDRAVEKLRERLARRGVTSTAAALAVALGNQVGAAAPAGLATAISGSALAGTAVAAGTGGLGAFFIFMTTTKITAGVVVALAITFGVREHARVRETQRELASVVQERDALRVRAGAARLAAEKREAGMRSQSTAAASESPVVAAAAPVNAEGGEVPEAMLDKFVAANPELQKLYAQQQTIRTRSRYGPFYQMAGLTAGQIAKFEQAVSNYEHAFLDVSAAAIAQGLDKNDPKLAALKMEATAERKRAQRAVLGKEAFAQLNDYERTHRMRHVAKDLAGELFYTNAPLTARQADELTRIVAESNAEVRGPQTWALIVSRAKERGVLSAPQLAVLNERKEQVDLGQRIEDMLGPLRKAVKDVGK